MRIRNGRGIYSSILASIPPKTKTTAAAAVFDFPWSGMTYLRIVIPLEIIV
jgi:hypothetical protein